MSEASQGALQLYAILASTWGFIWYVIAICNIDRKNTYRDAYLRKNGGRDEVDD